MLTTIISPRVSETDGAGHINNTVVPAWFEAGRMEIFRLLTPDLKFESWKVALVNLNIDYLKQIYIGRDCTVETWIDKVGNKSFVVSEQVLQDSEICAKGKATYVYYDYARETSLSIPDEIRAVFDGLRGPSDKVK